MKISVILCAHNPRADYLGRTLEALRGQTLPKSEWELLLVDNASKEPLANAFDLGWHPNARHLLEGCLGLTQARANGISHATSGLLVFVDDDTVLSPEYLETAWGIGERYPAIGVWGGQIRAEFEREPEPWMEPYLLLLTIVAVEKDQWSNIPGAIMPPGAGMCLRREVALGYLRSLENSPLRKSLLGRKGSSLAAGEDMDIGLTACDLGYETGMFTALKLIHLIGKARVSEDYLARVHEGGRYSMRILSALRGNWQPRQSSWIQRFRQWRYERGLEPRVRRIVQACRRGEEQADAYIKEHLPGGEPRKG